MTKNLFKVLYSNLVITFIVSSLLTFVTYLILSHRDTSSIEGKQADIAAAEGGVLCVLILTIFSLTTYLNLRKGVRKNMLFSLLTFFFAPILVTIVFLLTRDVDTEWLSFDIGIFYFFIAQIGNYLIFKKRTKTNSVVA